MTPEVDPWNSAQLAPIGSNFHWQVTNHAMAPLSGAFPGRLYLLGAGAPSGAWFYYSMTAGALSG